ncbi:MAG: hypothetical protein J2P37_10435 [Ktedonobacteraceae bacterium]|nr:hypothetical protein [Ktedonobacteraceae bacterium]MBO0792427.1 hypothetical protein [Ktedonobacteraceae bacterium]
MDTATGAQRSSRNGWTGHDPALWRSRGLCCFSRSGPRVRWHPCCLFLVDPRFRILCL